MSAFDARSAVRPPPDPLLRQIADYATVPLAATPLALDTARLCLLDSLACAFQALAFPQCTRLLGPVVPGATLPGGARVPGTSHELDPVKAAFDIGTLVRWLDFNDTWLAAEWGHPSDNLGAILATGDWLARRARLHGEPVPTVRDLLLRMIQAHEIQGVLALQNAFNRRGYDHVVLVRIASTAVATALLGGTPEQVQNAVSNAFVDGAALRTYRHAPNTGPRKSWAAGDATSRAVRHALLAIAGETGYPAALSTPTWGFEAVVMGGQPLALPRPFGCYVMENVLFKISYPAEFHAQTAVEAALALHAEVAPRLDDIERIEVETTEPGKRIIDKVGALSNYADRDHCLQYMIAVPLILGRLTAADYDDAIAADPRIDGLRAKMVVTENADFTRDYYDLDKRWIGNAIRVVFRDGTATRRVQVDVPVGHRERRAEGIPLLLSKFEASAAAVFPPKQLQKLLALAADPARLDALPVTEFVALLVKNGP